MQVVIIYESLTGTTEAAARLIANQFYERQVPSKIYPVGGFDPEAIAEADVIIAGSWTDGLILVGQKPAKRKKFLRLPDLERQEVRGVLHVRRRPGQDPRQVHQGARASEAPTCSAAWPSSARTWPTEPSTSSTGSWPSPRSDSPGTSSSASPGNLACHSGSMGGGDTQSRSEPGPGHTARQ